MGRQHFDGTNYDCCHSNCMCCTDTYLATELEIEGDLEDIVKKMIIVCEQINQ